jgi:proline racemase
LKVDAVDYHTAGEPFRIVTQYDLKGDTVLAKRRWAAANVDEVRRLLVNEPRGHADMYGCFVVEPNDAGADLGVVFFHNAGYSTACGHGTIALVTWAIDSGRVRGEEPETRVVVDVPSGRLHTVARVEEGAVRSVRFRNVPAYVHSEGEIPVAFGGAFYASVEERVEPSELPRLIARGREIKAALEREGAVVHPREPELRDVYGVIFWQHEQDGPPLVQRNVTVFADGEVDRSPCGSGTSARLALLHHEGRLRVGEELVHRSIVGSEFRAWIVEETDEGVVTEVEGSAHATGIHQFVLEPDDELGTGFLLR